MIDHIHDKNNGNSIENSNGKICNIKNISNINNVNSINNRRQKKSEYEMNMDNGNNSNIQVGGNINHFEDKTFRGLTEHNDNDSGFNKNGLFNNNVCNNMNGYIPNMNYMHNKDVLNNQGNMMNNEQYMMIINNTIMKKGIIKNNLFNELNNHYIGTNSNIMNSNDRS